MSARLSISVLLLLGLASTAVAQNSYRTYLNARYGTAVQYPANLVEPKAESQNGDGRKFVSRDGQIELTVYASNALNRSLRGEMSRALGDWRRDGARVTYQKAGAGFYALSGFIGDDIFYEKTLLRGEVFHSMIWQYPQTARRRLDEPVTRSVRTLSVGTVTYSSPVAASRTAAPTSTPVSTRRRTLRRASSGRKTMPTRGY